MKRFFLIIFAFTLSLFSAQTGKEIIEKNIELSGGTVNWKLLNSVMLQGKVSLGMKEVYPIRIFQERPNLTKTSITINGVERAVEGFDGTKGYAMNYGTNKVQEYPNYVPESFDNDFIDFENKGFTATYIGKEKVGEILCHKVELTKNVNKTKYWFDAKSFMLIKEEKKDETLVYSEYRKVGNLLFPFRIESSSPAKESDYVMMLNKIEINKVFPANTFKFK